MYLKDDNDINEYHQHMFKFDYPNSAWVKSCAAYLNEIFPDGVKNKIVIDYGFGQGNWSLAFLELGAKHVIAIDASTSAVESFSKYASEKHIDNITIVLGNTDEETLNYTADIIFLYGILHHVDKPQRLLDCAFKMCVSEDSQVLVYSYNADSLRQTIVNIARTAAVNTQNVIGKIALTLHPDARIRAMDDISAANVNFWTNEELEFLLRSTGLSITKQLVDFARFENKAYVPEFEPYVFIASPSDEEIVATTPQISPNLPDLMHINALAQIVIKELNEEERIHFISGLFNTLFAFQRGQNYFLQLFYIWRYLVNVGLEVGSLLQVEDLPSSTLNMFEATYKRNEIKCKFWDQSLYSNPDVSIASYIRTGGFRI